MSYKRMMAASAAAFMALAITVQAYAQDVIPLENDALNAVRSAPKANAIQADGVNLAAFGATTTDLVPLNDGELASFPVAAGFLGGILAAVGSDPINKVSATIDDADTVTFSGSGPQTYSFSGPGTQLQLDASSGGGMVSSSASVTQTSPAASQTIMSGATIIGR